MRYVKAWIEVVVEALIIPTIVALAVVAVLGICWLVAYSPRWASIGAIALVIFAISVGAAIHRVREENR